MKYIDADKLTKAIEDKGLDCSFALKMERLDTLALIDELKQEQPQVADASKMEQPGAPVDGEVHHVLNCHYLSTDNTQLCERLREFPEGAKVDIFIFAKEDK